MQMEVKNYLGTPERRVSSRLRENLHKSNICYLSRKVIATPSVKL